MNRLKSSCGKWPGGVLAALAAAIAGCTGGGRVELAALNFREIDPPPANFAAIDLNCCYWWTDDGGRVWVSMEGSKSALLGAMKGTFQMSLALDELPAGRARNYLVSQRELRGVARFGPAQSRFVSVAGIVALYREPGDRLKGSYRLDVLRQSQRLLGGWSPPSRFIMLGNFHAVPDTGRGRQIAAATEASGWEREAPSSQPAPEIHDFPPIPPDAPRPSNPAAD